MPNSIGLITKYGAENLDELLVAASKSAILEGDNALLRFEGAKTVYIPDIAMDGLGDYSRSTGFSTGDVTLTWTAYQMRKDRSKSFTIDNMDNEETAGVAFGHLVKEFIRTKVAPELDAYRFSTLLGNAANGNVTTAETISANTIITRFNADNKLLLDNEVEPTECIRFVSTEVNQLMENTTEIAKKISVDTYSNGKIETRVKMYNETPIIVVPANRFKSAYTFGTNGFTATSGAKDINFLTVHKNAAICVKKHEKIRVFTPDVNQTADAYKFDYRLYHDIFTPKNKQKGITASTK